MQALKVSELTLTVSKVHSFVYLLNYIINDVVIYV